MRVVDALNTGAVVLAMAFDTALRVALTLAADAVTADWAGELTAIDVGCALSAAAGRVARAMRSRQKTAVRIDSAEGTPWSRQASGEAEFATVVVATAL